MNMNENRYIWNPDDEAELARLVQQSNLYDRAIRDLFPPPIDPERLHQVLDVGCGPGGWVMSLAQSYKHCQVVGIDISPQQIAYAAAQAKVQRIENVQFLARNIFDSRLPDGFFDLVNMRFGVSFLDRESWPEFLKICHRLLKPGGSLVVFEGENSINNSAAASLLQHWTAQVMHRLGKGFGHGYSVGVVAMLEKLFKEAGYENTQVYPYVINSSTGSEMHAVSMRALTNIINQLQPFIITLLDVSQETFLETAQAAQEDMKKENYCCVTFHLSVVGSTPRDR
jgi:ubiquinone/menaquinone biosynthesis C-methylase UbiE